MDENTALLGAIYVASFMLGISCGVLFKMLVDTFKTKG